jgi:hypothetical protein
MHDRRGSLLAPWILKEIVAETGFDVVVRVPKSPFMVGLREDHQDAVTDRGVASEQRIK